MAILKFGPTVVGLRGTIGGITFSANKSSPYAKAWSRGSNPVAPLQTTQRGVLASIPALWRALTPAEQALWDTFAALPAQDLTNSLGETYSISGFGWFTKINVRLLVMGRADRTAVPAQSRPSAPTITDIEFPFDDGQTAFVSYAAGEFDPDFDLVLDIAQANSAGRLSPPSTFAEFVVSQNPNDTATGFMTAYVNRLGIGNTSLKGFARLYRQTTDGLRSSAGSLSFLAGDAPNYAPGALDYNSTTDFALRGGDLTGSADSTVWSAVGWFKIDGGAGSVRAISSCQGNNYEIRITGGNRFQFRAENAAGATIVDVTSTLTFAADSTWHSFMFSADTEAQTAPLFLDDLEAATTIATLTLDAIIDFTRVDHSFGARVGGSDFWDGCLSNFWMTITDALDFSDVAIRRSFVSPAGDPLDQGTAGQLPTGTPPILYFPDGDASNNAGSGGNYVNQSGAAACSDAP